MSFYADMAEVAADLLAEFGAAVTLRRVSGGTFSAVTGTASGESSSDITSTGVIKPFRADLIDGTRIQQGDKVLILDDSQVPALTDKVLIGTAAWNILDIDTVSPAGTPLVYFVHIRQ